MHGGEPGLARGSETLAFLHGFVEAVDGLGKGGLYPGAYTGGFHVGLGRGLIAKLYDPLPKPVFHFQLLLPLFHSPVVALVGTGLLDALALEAFTFSARRAGRRGPRRRASSPRFNRNLWGIFYLNFVEAVVRRGVQLHTVVHVYKHAVAAGMRFCTSFLAKPSPVSA